MGYFWATESRETKIQVHFGFEFHAVDRVLFRYSLGARDLLNI